MAIITQSAAITAANIVRDETIINANTCLRVGGLLRDMVDSMWPDEDVAAHISDITTNPHQVSIANIGAGTLAELNSAITDDDLYSSEQVDSLLSSYVPTTRTINTSAPLGGGGDLSADRTLTVSNATTSAVGVVRLTGDLGGTGAAPSVLRINGATVPVAGALTPGHVLAVSAASALTYALITSANISPTAGIAATQLAAGTNGQVISTVAGAAGWVDRGSGDYPQFLLRDGTRAMTAALDMGGFAITNVGTVDGVDVSAHAARHLPGGSDALTVGTPVTIGTANAAGSVNSFIRSDHVHAHGNQTSGSLHAVATGSTSGFMSTSMVGQLASSVSHYGTTGNPHGTSIADIGTGTLAELNAAISDANVVPTTRTINTSAPLGGGGDLSADRTLTVSNATTSAVGVVRLTGDLGGTGATPSVLRINGATVPVAGALGTGVVLMASGVSALTYALLTTSNISSSAAITATQLAAGGANNVLLGGASNTWGQITNAQISSSAAVAVSKLATGAENTVLWSNGTANSWTTSPVLYSVDVTNDVSIGSAPAAVGGLRLSFNTDVNMRSYEGTDVEIVQCHSGTGALAFGALDPLRAGATLTQVRAPSVVEIVTGATTGATFTSTLLALGTALSIGGSAATTGDLRFNDEASVYGVGASGDTQLMRFASSSSTGSVYFGPHQSMGGSANHTQLRAFGGNLQLAKDGSTLLSITGTTATFDFGSDPTVIGDGYVSIGSDVGGSGDIRLGNGVSITAVGASGATSIIATSASSGTGNTYLGPGTALGGSQNHTYVRATGGNFAVSKDGGTQLVITGASATYDFGDWPVSIADGALRLTDRAGTIPSGLSGNSVLFSSNDALCGLSAIGTLWELSPHASAPVCNLQRVISLQNVSSSSGITVTLPELAAFVDESPEVGGPYYSFFMVTAKMLSKQQHGASPAENASLSMFVFRAYKPYGSSTYTISATALSGDAIYAEHDGSAYEYPRISSIGASGSVPTMTLTILPAASSTYRGTYLVHLEIFGPINTGSDSDWQPG